MLSTPGKASTLIIKYLNVQQYTLEHSTLSIPTLYLDPANLAVSTVIQRKARWENDG